MAFCSFLTVVLRILWFVNRLSSVYPPIVAIVFIYVFILFSPTAWTEYHNVGLNFGRGRKYRGLDAFMEVGLTDINFFNNLTGHLSVLFGNTRWGILRSGLPRPPWRVLVSPSVHSMYFIWSFWGNVTNLNPPNTFECAPEFLLCQIAGSIKTILYGSEWSDFHHQELHASITTHRLQREHLLSSFSFPDLLLSLQWLFHLIVFYSYQTPDLVKYWI